MSSSILSRVSSNGAMFHRRSSCSRFLEMATMMNHQNGIAQACSRYATTMASDPLDDRLYPSVRVLFAQHGLSVRNFDAPGSRTGAGGRRILKADVLRLIQSEPRKIASKKPATTTATTPPGRLSRGWNDVALDEMKMQNAQQQTETKRQTPHVYMSCDVQVDAIVKRLVKGEARETTVGDVITRMVERELRSFLPRGEGHMQILDLSGHSHAGAEAEFGQDGVNGVEPIITRSSTGVAPTVSIGVGEVDARIVPMTGGGDGITTAHFLRVSVSTDARQLDESFVAQALHKVMEYCQVAAEEL